MLLLRSPFAAARRYIPHCVVANFLAFLALGDLLLVASGFALCNAAKVLVAFLVMRRALAGLWHRFTTRRGIKFTLVASVLAPLVSALIGATLVNTIYGSPFWGVVKTWWIAQAMRFLLVTPAILSWNANHEVRGFRKRSMERVAIAVAVVTTTTYGFTQPHFPVLFAVTPLLLRAAFRLESFATAVAALSMCVISVAATVHGIGLIALLANGNGNNTIQFLQLYLGIAVLVPFVVAVLIEAPHRLISKLESKNTELERSAFTVSHDLKAPLITIAGFLRHLREDIDAGSTTDIDSGIKEIESATQTINTLMQDLLELSKHGVVANSDELVTVSKLIQKLVNSLPEAATISVESSIDSSAVRGDAQRLSIAVRNILDNAQKFAGNTQPLLVKH